MSALLDGLDDEAPARPEAPRATAGSGLLEGLDDAPGGDIVSTSFEASGGAPRAPAAPAPPPDQPGALSRFAGGVAHGFVEGAGLPGRLVGEAANVLSPGYDPDAIAQPGPRLEPMIAAGKVDRNPSAAVRGQAAVEGVKDAAMTGLAMHPVTRLPMLVGGLGMQAYRFAQNPTVEGAGEAVGGVAGGMAMGKLGEMGLRQVGALQPLPRLGEVPAEISALRRAGTNAVPQGAMPELPSAAAEAVAGLEHEGSAREGAVGALSDLERDVAGAHMPNPALAQRPPVTGLEDAVPSAPTPRTTALRRPAMISPEGAATPDTRVLPHEPVATADLIDRRTGQLTEPGEMTARTFTSPKANIEPPTAQRVVPTGAHAPAGADVESAPEPTPDLTREAVHAKQPGNLPQPASIEERYGPGARVLRGHTVIQGEPSETMIPMPEEVPAGSPAERAEWVARTIVDRVLGDDARTITPADGDLVARLMNGNASPTDIDVFQHRPDLRRFAWRLGKLQSEAPERFPGAVVGRRNPWEMVSKDVLGLSSDQQIAPVLDRLAKADPMGAKPTPNYGVASRDVTHRPPNALTGLRAQAVAAAHESVAKPALRAQAARDLQMLSDLRFALKQQASGPEEPSLLDELSGIAGGVAMGAGAHGINVTLPGRQGMKLLNAGAKAVGAIRRAVRGKAGGNP